MFSKTTVLKAIFCLFISLSLTQGTYAQDDEVLTNESIIQLTEAGLAPSVITQKIKSEHTHFDVSTAGLSALTKAKVAPAVMNAMMTAAAKDKMSNVDPNDPKALHPAGLYYFSKADNTLKPMVEGIYSKDDGFSVKNTFGGGYVKDGEKLSIEGTAARLQVSDPSPVFYLYTDPKNHTPAFPSSFTPNMLVLTSINVRKKDRMIELGSYDMVNGSKKGVSADSKSSFDSEKIGENRYKITFSNNLPAGEYGFCVGKSFTKTGSTSTGANKVFDFGVK